MTLAKVNGATDMVSTCDFDISSHAEQDVIRLDVSVHDLLLVEVLNALQHLPADGGHQRLRQYGAQDYVRESAGVHVLHGHPELSENNRCYWRI